MPAKNRTFNGCWTCRERKIKCDLKRPGCLRCKNSNLECKGYDVKLRWLVNMGLQGTRMVALNGSDDSDDPGTQRSSVDFVKYPKHMIYLTFSRLNHELKALETSVETNKGAQDVERGPFGAYHWPVSSQVGAAESEGADISHDQASWIHHELVESARLSIMAIKGPDYIIQDQNMLHILYPKFFPNIDSDDWLVSQAFLNELMTLQGQDLIVKSTFWALLKHLDSRQFAFSKVYWPDNYWSLVIIPYINCLVGEYVCNYETWNGQYNENFSPAQLVNNLKLAALYLALGMAAFSLARHHPQYLAVSLKIRKVCSTILNSHLDDYDSNSDHFSYNQIEYENLMLLCILLQIQFDGLFGVFENYNLAFAIGDYIVQNKFKHRDLPNLSTFLVHTFTIASVFYLATLEVNVFNYSIDPTDISNNYRDLDENYDLIEGLKEDQVLSPSLEASPGEIRSAPNSSLSTKRRKIDHLSLPNALEPLVTTDAVYLMWGYKKQMLDLFLRIIHLTNHKSIFRSRKVFPRNFPKICAEMEDELNTFDVSQFDLANPPFRLVLHEGLYRNAKCLHLAMRVYFTRLIKEAPLKTYQHIIESCLDELDQLLLLNDRPGSDYSFKPPFFIVLICGSDAVVPQLQERIKKLWNNPHFGWANQWRAKQILYEVWKRREVGEDVSWMDLVREWDLVLYMG